MDQVGQTKTFALSVTPPANSGVYAYVWTWWDQTVTVTSVPRVEKTLNMGGDPNNSRKLYYTCMPVMEDGRSTVITGQVTVNNEPYIVPSPEISNNDDFFPYRTQIKVTAYDVEGDAMSFLYYDSGGTPLGGGTTTSVGPVNGTWNGTGSTYTGYQNVFNGTITAQSEITLKIVDAANGTRSVDFNFYGQTPPAPVIGAVAEADGITADATSVPDQRIGPGQSVSFTVYAADPVSSNFQFLWSFYGSLGWNGNSFSTGTTSSAPDGSALNSYTKSIENETGGAKTVLVKVTNVDSAKHVEIPLYVSLVANSVASACTFTIVDELGVSYADGDTVVEGRKLHYAATVVDPQNDVLQFKWTISQPSGINPTTLRKWGREVILDTTGFTPGFTITGSLLAIDRMEGLASFTIPSLIVSA